VKSRFLGANLSSDEIDREIRQAQRKGEPLYWLDVELLRELSPEVIFLQSLCSVCQIDGSTVEREIASLKARPKLVYLNPHSLGDVLENVSQVAESLGQVRRGEDLRVELEGRVARVKNKTAAMGTKRSVCVLEWLSPLYNSGHWISEQVAAAGAEDRLANPGGQSSPLEWEMIRRYDPEFLFIAPCGFSVERSISEIDKLLALPGWQEMKAVKRDKVFFLDGNLLTEPSPNLVLGIETLAALMFPTEFSPPPERLARRLCAASGQGAKRVVLSERIEP